MKNSQRARKSSNSFELKNRPKRTRRNKEDVCNDGGLATLPGLVVLRAAFILIIILVGGVLINVRVWIERTHCVLDFHLTQILSGHGSFETYLCGIGKRDTPTCPHCHRGDDYVEHTFFLCTKWMECRTAAWSQLGGNVTIIVVVVAENIIGDEEN